MRSTGELIMALVESGLNDAQKALVLELAAQATASHADPSKAAKSARNARYYQSKKLNKTPETRLNQATESGLNKSSNGLIQSPLARVEDNLLRLEVTGKLSLSIVRERAGDALASDATSPGVAVLTPLTSLLSGPDPCNLDEVYDGVAKAAAWYRAKRPPGSMSNWDLARKMALELRDQRLTGTPQPKASHERPDTPSAKRTAREDNLERGFRVGLAASGP